MNEQSNESARMDRNKLDENALELAALYALSALSPAEMEAVERDYQGRGTFWDEVRSLRDAAVGLAEAGPRVRPRGDLWPRIRARLDAAPASARVAASGRPAQVWKQWRAETGDAHREQVIVPSAGPEAFEATGFPGVRVRCLVVDEHADRVTMLVRMDPGASYPSHRHGDAEECFVVQGDLEIGTPGEKDAVELRAGDFQRMERDSHHAVQSTRGGCLLLITSSRQDELLG